MVDHFIDSSGVVSWSFFSASPDYEFVDWNVAGTTEDEYTYLMDILRDLDKEVYIADLDDLGANACRILVPGYSEVYEVEELVWTNTNRGVPFRSDILNIHSLDNATLESLLDRLEDSDFDEYLLISELIGVAFDDHSPWGRCTVSELKGLICLALGRHDEAKHWAGTVPSIQRQRTRPADLLSGRSQRPRH